MPDTPVQVLICRALENWNVTQAAFGQPMIHSCGTLAALLVAALDQEGWCLSDLSDGSILAYDPSDLWETIEPFLPVHEVDP